jgi:hypothetical protein
VREMPATVISEACFVMSARIRNGATIYAKNGSFARANVKRYSYALCCTADSQGGIPQ